MAQPGDVLLNATGAGTLGRASALLNDSAKIFDVCIVRIRRLIEEAREAEKTAKGLMERAKSRVGQLIEEAVRS